MTHATLELQGRQSELLEALKATGKPLVVVLIHGRAYCLNWIAENAEAILDAFYPGQEGGTAVADVLFGEYNPGGRLTVSVPRHVGQLPVTYYHRHPRPKAVGLDSAEPLFPFGYGLSYTSFFYTNLRVTPERIAPDETARVSVEVTNTGDRAGDEVVQLYIRDEVASLMRPGKELRGFERIHLEPGEAQTVSFKVGHEELCFYGPGGDWIVEPGDFTLMVAPNSRDPGLQANLTVTK